MCVVICKTPAGRDWFAQGKVYTDKEEAVKEAAMMNEAQAAEYKAVVISDIPAE